MASAIILTLALFYVSVANGSYLTNRVFKWTHNVPTDYTSQGKELRNHWFFYSTKRDVRLCAYSCLKSSQCQSYNYYKSNGRCYLNRKNHNEVSLEGASADISYHHRDEYVIDQDALGPCAGDPCNGHGRCLETKTSDDELIAICLCSKGWGGSRCDMADAVPEWGTWQAWDDCSVTCDRGYRLRTRNCEDGSNGQTLSSMECYGRDIEYEACTMPGCPRWDVWGEWGNCTTYQTCGRGYKVRHRTCTNGGTPGVDRYCLGSTNETTVCYGLNCKGLMRLRGGAAYGEGRVELYNDVSKEWGLVCGDQWTLQAADLVCKQLGMPGAYQATQDSRFGAGEGQYGVTSLSCTGVERTVQMCERNPWSLSTTCGTPTQPAGVVCKVNGVWTLWEEWGGCSVTCEGGIRQRTRSCNHPPALHGGRDCVGDTMQTKSCTLDMCPGNGTWLEWGAWSLCDVTCGIGEQLRERVCLNETEVCTGGSTETQQCDEGSCTTGPVDGQWRTWGEWATCSTSCGKGTQWRERTCNGPFHNGLDCTGEKQQTQECQIRECPVDGVWNGWETWGDCTVICGGGTRLRTRTCQGPFFEGAPCPGDESHTETCNPFECPVDGAWLPWHDWRDCNVTCGGGQQIRKRDCSKPKHGGNNCEGPSQEMRDCSTQNCPVDATWQQWATWETCNASCGGGTQRRMRTCQEGLHGGLDCTGPAEEFQDCNMHACPENKTKTVLVDGEEVVMVEVNGTWIELVDGSWQPWNEWSACSHRCGTGTQTRNRTCDGPFFGGQDCAGSSMDVLNCNTHSCAVDGIWKTWSYWSKCSVTCGGSTISRSRLCEGPYFGGTNCSGSWQEEVQCGADPCPIDGVWESWLEWSGCPVTCGGSLTRRTRSCNGPLFDGKNCSGSWFEEKQCGTDPCPIDGVWLPWSDWSSCSVTCGGSKSQRSRTCDGPKYGGKNCSEPWNEEKVCGTHPCPIDGEWEGWSSWGTCNVSCGGGSRSRSRACNEPKFGGKKCYGDTVELKNCNDNPCPIDGVFHTWEEWGPCSLSCGGGEKLRDRKCIGPYHGGSNCTGPWDDQGSCNTQPCPVDGTWLPWGEFNECDLTCGGGLHSRRRMCESPQHGGAYCEGSNEEQETCNNQNCPVNGEWDSWSLWTTCSLTCGGGIQWRERECIGPFWGGYDCLGDVKESRECNSDNCPEDGYFDQWSVWGDCDVTCGGGLRWRNRTCIGPFYGGADCEGARNESETCNADHCPVDGVFNDWSDWGECSVTCGGGDKWRQRTCHGPFYGGADCVGPRDNSATCNEQNCPVDGIWAEWAKWSTCTHTCGGGQQWRTRNCIGPFDGGTDCEGPRNTTQACNIQNCPIDGVYEPWSEWGLCGLTCGGGTRDRTRVCIQPQYGGRECPGPPVDTTECNTQHCPVDGFWREWGYWGPCSTTCGGGIMQRVRVCEEPQYGGADCVGPGDEERKCGFQACPIPGDWFDWSDWSPCSVTCGGGEKSRSRICDTASFGNLTAPCEGPEDETIDCHTFACTPLARTCSEWGNRGLTADTMADIDPDEEEGPLEETRVWCDMTSNDGVGVTIIGHEDMEEVEVVGYEGAGEYRLKIQYNITLAHTIAVIDASESCRQFVRWRCKAALIHNPFGEVEDGSIITTGWTNRSEGIADYFGDAPPGSGKCSCGVTNTCVPHDDKVLVCNCDKNDNVWREDSGYLSYKEDLPVREFIAGDTGSLNEGGKHTVGPVKCLGALT